jgi:hypothetical protein
MAYTTNKNELVLSFRDIRQELRTKRIELGGLVVVTDDDATEFNGVSKSVVRRYVQQNEQIDTSLVADADSEVNDTLRLNFLLPNDSKWHLDIPDPHDELFLSTTGPGANIVKDKAVLAAAVSPEPEYYLNVIIDKVLAGSILISDGETPTAYLDGERI